MRAMVFGMALVLAGCTAEENLAAAAASGRLTSAEIHTASVNLNTAEALKKASTPEEKAAIMAKYYCDVAWEQRRSIWLGNRSLEAPEEYSNYMRSDPAARAKYWQSVSAKTGCTF